MKVLIVGGAGYIGSHTTLELLKENNEVIIIDNISSGKEENLIKEATFYNGDITNKDDLMKVFSNECNKKPFDMVMHFAAKTLVGESVEKPLEYYYNNVEGVRLLLEVMTEFNIKNIIFSSTAAVYGEPDKEICEEDDILKPINPYGASKLACEEMIKWVSNAYNMNYGIFRYFNVAGADESLTIGYNYNKKVITHLIPIVAEVALGIREKLKVFGDNYNTPDGTCIRDYLHVTDLAKAHILGAHYVLDNNKSFTVNLGTSSGYSVKEIIKATESILPMKYEVTEKRPGDPDKLVASSKKAKEILGWTPEHDIYSIIKTEIDYRKKLDEKK